VRLGELHKKTIRGGIAMKKETFLNDYLSKYTLKQFCEGECTDSDDAPSMRLHYRHKKQLRKVSLTSHRDSRG